jgi:hypothetical protein
MLVEFGQLHAIDGDDGNTKYAPNYQLRYISEVTALINDHTREELRAEIAAIQDEIDAWKAEFDVESRDELESTLTAAEVSGDAIRDRNRVLREWDRRVDNKRLLRHALELYEDARQLYPGASTSSVTLP